MITITILAICFIASLSIKIKKTKKPLFRIFLWYFHLMLLCISLLCILLMINDFGLRGTQTERLCFTLYVGSAILLFGLTDSDPDARYAYLLSFFGFPFLLLLGILLPPLRTMTMVAALILLSDSNFERYTIDDRFMLQTKTSGILTNYPVYSLIEKKYLLFEKIKPEIIKPQGYLHSLQLTKKGKDSVHIHLKTTASKIDTVLSLQPE